MTNSYRPGFEKFDWPIASLSSLSTLFPAKIQQMRLKQCDSGKALQIIDRRPIYPSQQFEEIMKIKTFSKERSFTHYIKHRFQCFIMV